MSVNVGDSIRIKVHITDGDGCDSPRVLIASPGDVLQITQVDERGVCARHHDYPGSHMGFWLRSGEYEPSTCRCNQVKRPAPCWTVPIPIFDGMCSVCKHTAACHTHTTQISAGRCPDCDEKPDLPHRVTCPRDPFMRRLNGYGY
jgi:hypothetical protein